MNKLFVVQLMQTSYSSKPTKDEFIAYKKGSRIDTVNDINQAEWYTPKRAQAIAYDCNQRFKQNKQLYKAQVVNTFTHPKAIIER